MSQCLQKKISMTLELDRKPRYFIKKVPQYPYSVPSTDVTGNGTKKVPWYFSTRHCPPLLFNIIFFSEIGVQHFKGISGLLKIVLVHFGVILQETK